MNFISIIGGPQKKVTRVTVANVCSKVIIFISISNIIIYNSILTYQSKTFRAISKLNITHIMLNGIL